ncbi:MAG: hypothetical protein R3C28_15655 [Pirellulaceae bacterium]
MDVHTSAKRQLRWLAGVLLVVTAACAGCAQWKISDAKFPWKKDAQLVRPTRIVPMWTDTILYESGKPGVRGFGARIYFYPDEGTDPVEVDGSLVVYAFDGDNYDAHMPVPEKKFVFTAEQFAEHHSVTKVGHSYSVWLPWDEVGGEARQITLITRFHGADGTVVVSEPNRKLLPGIRGKEANESTGVQQASYQQQSGTGQTKNGQMSPITIDLPPSFVRRLRDANRREQSYLPQRPEDPRSDTDMGDTDSASSAASLQSMPQDGQVRSYNSDGAQVTVGGQGPQELPYRSRLSSHFADRGLPARTAGTTRPTVSVPRRQPYLSEPLSGLPPTPRYSLPTPR